MVDMPPGTSQERTDAVLEQLDQILATVPEIEYRQKISGYSFMVYQGATYGTVIIKLKNWEERKRKDQSSDAILGKLYAMTSVIKDGRVVMFAPPMISGYSLTNGFEIKMQDKTGGSVEDFFAVVQGFLAQLNQQPEVQVAMTTFNPTFPQYLVDIDAAKAKAGRTVAPRHSDHAAGLLRRYVCQQLQPFRQDLPRDDAGLARGARKPRDPCVDQGAQRRRDGIALQLRDHAEGV